MNLTALLSCDVPHGSQGFRGHYMMTGVIRGQLHALKALSIARPPRSLGPQASQEKESDAQLKTSLIRNVDPANHIVRYLGGFSEVREDR